ncbi:MAG: hypothetical protein QNJ13_11130 [Paracoccaceae bacterium]|nr:hypothetical protein [Paracoccaceae bacterium]
MVPIPNAVRRRRNRDHLLHDTPKGRLFSLAMALLLVPISAFAETRTFDLAGFDGVSVASGVRVFVDVG